MVQTQRLALSKYPKFFQKLNALQCPAVSRRGAGINIQIDLPPPSPSSSHNSSLLWWEHCRRAQVAIQLFNEYDNYFSHMPRLCTNTCSGAQHQEAMEPSPRRPHAIIVDVLFVRRLLFHLLHVFALIPYFWGSAAGGRENSSRPFLGEPRLPLGSFAIHQPPH